MALKSRTDILNEGANAEGASNEAILMAALNESQRKYEALSGEILRRLEAVEASVTASNTERVQNYTEALKEASDEVLGDIQGELEALKGEVQETVLSLQGAREKKEKSETLEMFKFFGIAFAVIVAAFYVALLLYGWWYDIPEAVKGVTNHNTMLEAINNGIYQLLNR